MQAIRLNVDALEVKSFATTAQDEKNSSLAESYITSAVSETDGVFNCKSCGPCCM